MQNKSLRQVLRIRELPLALAMVATLMLAGCGGSGTQTASGGQQPGGSQPVAAEWHQNVMSFWNGQDLLFRQIGPAGFENSAGSAGVYPAETAITFLSAYKLTGESRYVQDAVQHLAYAHNLEQPDHFLLLPPGTVPNAPPGGLVSSLAQSRQWLADYIAYKETGDPRYLNWADDGISALLHLPTTSVCNGSRCFNLYSYLYAASPPYAAQGGAEIDPNQGGFHAAIATLLYFDTASRYYQSAALAHVAKDNIEAALSLMDGQGRLPLNSEPVYAQAFDTRYGAAVLFLIAWANRYWQNAGYDTALKLGAGWLNSFNHAPATTVQYYPQFYSGAFMEPEDAYYRLGVVLLLGGDHSGLDGALSGLWTNWQPLAPAVAGYTAPFVVYDELGIARTEYWH